MRGVRHSQTEQVNVGRGRKAKSQRKKTERIGKVFESRRLPLLLHSSTACILWEEIGACGESKVRQGLSGTKLQIHMICLAKRVKEKMNQRFGKIRDDGTIKTRHLPWDRQEMNIIYKLFSGWGGG